MCRSVRGGCARQCSNRRWRRLLALRPCALAAGATAICPYSEGDVIRCTTDHAIHRIQGGRKRYYSGGAYTADGTPPPTVDGQEVCTARRQCEDGPDMPDPTISVQEQHEQRMAAITLSSEEGAAQQQEAVAKRLTRTAAGVSAKDALQGDGVTFLDGGLHAWHTICVVAPLVGSQSMRYWY